MAKQTIMKNAALKRLLNKLPDDYEIWLSSDAEGNVIRPMPKNQRLCIVIDEDAKKIFFRPVHGGDYLSLLFTEY